ncbi:hypothetical protein WMW72_17815 [Paenibacillus filicis]|uniref:HEPN domain-containing protein n=1 Tax=Paenibacillus filicis TaxID=669464 RepID=A0ABU9DLN3_9BACL
MNRQKLLDKAEVLKQYEPYSYQVAYALLRNESLAVQAAKRVFIGLFEDDLFYHQLPSVQRLQVKQASMKQALLSYKHSAINGVHQASS